MTQPCTDAGRLPRTNVRRSVIDATTGGFLAAGVHQLVIASDGGAGTITVTVTPVQS